MSNQELFSRKSLYAALKAWDELGKLGGHPFVRLQVVQNRHQLMGRGDMPGEWGLSLRDLLRAAIEGLRVDEGEADYENKRWRGYISLKEEFIDGRDPDYLAAQMGNIALRTYQHVRRRAMDKVVGILHEWEEEAIGRDAAAEGAIGRGGVFLAPPKAPYRLVGRYNLLETLKGRLFAKGYIALCALNGLPGVGKTALALELAHDKEVVAHFRDGILWAGLGREPDLLSLLGNWCTALGISSTELANLSTVAERAQAIHGAIGMRKMLLVIDDAWQLKAGLAFQVGGPYCAHLLTTRKPEIARDFAEEGAIIVKELSDPAGLLLFNKLVPALAEAEPEEAQKLVQAVGGLPLAIILIARHTRREADKGAYPLRRVLNSLQQAEKRLKLAQPQPLVGSHPSLPVGAPLSLQAAIEISDDALDENARQALRGLSVFPPKPNTFSQEAALTVSNTIPDTLDTLVSYGLLEPSGANRYTLHQTIADYAALKCTSHAPYERMATFFVDYVKRHEQDVAAIEVETNNMLAALDAAYKQSMESTLVQGTNAFYHFLHIKGLYALAESSLKRVEQIARASEDDLALSTTLANLGKLTENRGDYTQSQRYYQEALILLRVLEPHIRICHTLSGLATIAVKRGAYEQAERYNQEGLALARKLAYQKGICSFLLNLGIVAIRYGHYSSAEAYLEEGLALACQIKDAEVICTLLQNLGIMATRQAAYSRAERYLLQALTIARQLGFRERICTILRHLGNVAWCRGMYAQAEAYYRQGMQLAEQIGHRENICYLLLRLGNVAHYRGKLKQAEVYYQKGLQLARKLHHSQNIILLCTNLGTLFTRRAEFTQAKRYYQEALTLAYRTKHPWLASATLLEWGQFHLAPHNWDAKRAASIFHEALQIAQELGIQEYEAKALYGLAQVAEGEGDYALAEQQGEQSLIILQRIAHGERQQVRGWLTQLKNKAEG